LNVRHCSDCKWKQHITRSSTERDDSITFCSPNKITTLQHSCLKVIVCDPFRREIDIWFNLSKKSLDITNRFFSPRVGWLIWPNEDDVITSVDSVAQEWPSDTRTVEADRRHIRPHCWHIDMVHKNSTVA